MKNTDEMLAKIREMSNHFKANDNGPINLILEPLLDDIDSLRSQLQESYALLERTKNAHSSGHTMSWGGCKMCDIISHYEKLKARGWE